MTDDRRWLRWPLAGVVCASLAACTVAPPATPRLVRHANLSVDSPTSAAVEVPAMATLVFVSGQTPVPRDPAAERFGAAYWGDTAEQTRSVLDKIDAALRRVGLGPADVVKATVFLVAPSGGDGRADTAGFARAWAERFGSAAQPDRPARSTVQIAALGAPGMLVEIEVIAAHTR